jgi:outer membrane protein assembly factor BamB
MQVVGDVAGMVTKLDGADGAQLWQRNVSTTDAVRNLVVDGAGDVFVGTVDVVKLAGLDGSELWKILELRPSYTRAVPFCRCRSAGRYTVESVNYSRGSAYIVS